MASNEELMDTSELNATSVSKPNVAMMSSEILTTTGPTVISQQHTLVSALPMTTDDIVTRPELKDGVRPRSITPDGQNKKRRRIDPTEDMQTLYDFMRKYKREDGSELCEMFVRAPKRRNDPQYYEVVSDPIDMLRIKQKLSTDEYANMNEMKEDFERLFSNALSYYKKGTSEARDAQELKELFIKAIGVVEAGEDPVAALGDREDNDDAETTEMVEDLFGSVMTATDLGDSDRYLNQVFRLLPSKQVNKEYNLITDIISINN
jgi:protein polybromo-1